MISIPGGVPATRDVLLVGAKEGGRDRDKRVELQILEPVPSDSRKVLLEDGGLQGGGMASTAHTAGHGRTERDAYGTPTGPQAAAEP